MSIVVIYFASGMVFNFCDVCFSSSVTLCRKELASSLESFVLLQRGEEGTEKIVGTSGPAEEAGRGARMLAEAHFASFVFHPQTFIPFQDPSVRHTIVRPVDTR